MPLDQDVELDELARKTDGYTGADLEDLVRRAGKQALRSDLEVESVSMRFFREALEDSRASVTPEMEKEYRQLAERLKQERADGSRRIGFARDGGDGER
jgi:transitional endoplasmic reticulum ATPase